MRSSADRSAQNKMQIRRCLLAKFSLNIGPCGLACENRVRRERNAGLDRMPEKLVRKAAHQLARA